MKNKKQLFATFIAVGAFLIFPLFVYGKTVLNEGVRIVIRTKDSSHSTAPRAPIFNPFYAELTDFGVALYANCDWGYATVTISSDQGDYFQTPFNMSDGVIILPTNGSNGDRYAITIFVESGMEFEGFFIL